MKYGLIGCAFFALAATLLPVSSVAAAAPEKAAEVARAEAFVLVAPVEYQVVQRDAQDRGRIPVKVKAAPEAAAVRVRAVPGPEAKKGSPTDWVGLKRGDGFFDGELTAAAGGWYRLEAEVLDAQGAVLKTLSVPRVGVGEVFLTYGQSNSVSYGRNRAASKSPLSVCMNPKTCRWQPCRDPQPTMGGAQGAGGSCWPTVGDLLTEQLGVPVGFVACGWGGATLGALIPGARSHHYENRLRDAVRKLPKHGFRAILFHQGESDSWRRTPEKVYVRQMQGMIEQSRKDAGWQVPWGIANISRSNVAFMAFEDAVLRAQRSVAAADPLVFNGPYTDAMEQNDQSNKPTQYRGDNTHFNARGARIHGTWWARIIGKELFGLPTESVELKTAADTIRVGEPLAYTVTVRGRDGQVLPLEAEPVLQYTGDAAEAKAGTVLLKSQPKGMPALRLFVKVRLPGAPVDAGETGNRLTGYIVSDPVLLTIVPPEGR